MSDLINKIRQAQVRAGENVVMRDLEAKGLIPKEKKNEDEINEFKKEILIDILGLDNPYPLKNVLEKLKWATEYLLHQKITMVLIMKDLNIAFVGLMKLLKKLTKQKGK